MLVNPLDFVVKNLVSVVVNNGAVCALAAVSGSRLIGEHPVCVMYDIVDAERKGGVYLPANVLFGYLSKSARHAETLNAYFKVCVVILGVTCHYLQVPAQCVP